MIITVPKCGLCKKSDKVMQKSVWFRHKDRKHYIVVWLCERCNFCFSIAWIGG